MPIERKGKWKNWNQIRKLGLRSAARRKKWFESLVCYPCLLYLLLAIFSQIVHTLNLAYHKRGSGATLSFYLSKKINFVLTSFHTLFYVSGRGACPLCPSTLTLRDRLSSCSPAYY